MREGKGERGGTIPALFSTFQSRFETVEYANVFLCIFILFDD